MNIGERVYVETPLFSGAAIINYIASMKEFFPIQVELEKPAFDGHKLKRVAVDEVKPLPTEKKKYLAEVVRPRLGYVVGERYIITDKDSEGYFSVYLLKRPDHAPIGSYKSDFFKIIEPYIEEQPVKTSEPIEFDVLNENVIKTSSTKENAAEGKIKANKRKRKKSGAPDGQITIFDILGELI